MLLFFWWEIHANNLHLRNNFSEFTLFSWEVSHRSSAMEEMAMRKKQAVAKKKGMCMPNMFPKGLNARCPKSAIPEAFHGWWPLLGRTSSMQGPAKLLLRLAMEQRGDNCRKTYLIIANLIQYLVISALKRTYQCLLQHATGRARKKNSPKAKVYSKQMERKGEIL